MEALVSPQTGEVICIKPDGAFWGREERKLLQVIDWKTLDAADKAIEDQLAASEEREPKAVYPFIQTKMESPHPQMPPQKVIVTDADGRVYTKYADMTKLDASIRKGILDPTKAVPKVMSGILQVTSRPAAVTSSVPAQLER